MHNYKAAILNRIEQKLNTERMRPYLKPKNIAKRKEEVELLHDIMEDIKAKNLAKRKNEEVWMLISDDFADYLEAFKGIEERKNTGN